MERTQRCKDAARIQTNRKTSGWPAGTTCKHIRAMSARPTATVIRRETGDGNVILEPGCDYSGNFVAYGIKESKVR